MATVCVCGWDARQHTGSTVPPGMLLPMRALACVACTGVRSRNAHASHAFMQIFPKHITCVRYAYMARLTSAILFQARAYTQAQMVYDNLNKVPSVCQRHRTTNTTTATKKMSHIRVRAQPLRPRTWCAAVPAAAAKYLFQFNYTKCARNAHTRPRIRAHRK